MKLLLSFLFLIVTTLSNAAELPVVDKTDVKTEVFDGRKRKQKRTNKKRKKKCKQFGRRIYAG